MKALRWSAGLSSPPADQKALRSVVAGFRHDGSFDVGDALTSMGVGEALVSTLNPDGSPSPVMRTVIRPPESRIGPITAEERADLICYLQQATNTGDQPISADCRQNGT